MKSLAPFSIFSIAFAIAIPSLGEDSHLRGRIQSPSNNYLTDLTLQNYVKVVENDKKDVLVEYYAEWCPHCRNLAPRYLELANLYGNHTDKVTIARIDAWVNKPIPKLQVKGFPLMYLWPANDKEKGVQYTGPRSLKSFAEFIRDKGAQHVDVVKEAEKIGENDKHVKKALAHGLCRMVDGPAIGVPKKDIPKRAYL